MADEVAADRTDEIAIDQDPHDNGLARIGLIVGPASDFGGSLGRPAGLVRY
jgi:hypothetical protein